MEVRPGSADAGGTPAEPTGARVPRRRGADDREVQATLRWLRTTGGRDRSVRAPERGGEL